MLLETLFIMIGLCALTVWSHQQSIDSVLWGSIFLQGCWMQRVLRGYMMHTDCIRRNPNPDNVVGQLFLWVLLVPLSIFRKIHDFHHSANHAEMHRQCSRYILHTSERQRTLAILMQRLMVRRHLVWQLVPPTV